MALEAALPVERLRHNIYPEMSFPALSMSGVPGVLVGFVDHLHASRGESLGQLLGDDIASCHGLGIAGAGPVGQSGENRSPRLPEWLSKGRNQILRWWSAPGGKVDPLVGEAHHKDAAGQEMTGCNIRATIRLNLRYAL